jgi:hypothetical protein
MERTLIAFNLPNIISIVLMAALGYVVLTALAQVFIRQQTTAAPSAVGSA